MKIDLITAVFLQRMPREVSSLLDIGCGDGRMTAILDMRAGRAVGLDRDATAIESARSRFSDHKHLSFIIGDFQQLGKAINREKFDLICSALALHHAHHLQDALEEVREHVRPGGQIIIVDLYSDGIFSLPHFILDQCVFSNVRQMAAFCTTCYSFGVIRVFQFLLRRIAYVCSDRGRTHVRSDLAAKLPPTIGRWTTALDAAIPGGARTFLLGGLFAYLWQKVE